MYISPDPFQLTYDEVLHVCSTRQCRALFDVATLGKYVQQESLRCRRNISSFFFQVNFFPFIEYDIRAVRSCC